MCNVSEFKRNIVRFENDKIIKNLEHFSWFAVVVAVGFICSYWINSICIFEFMLLHTRTSRLDENKNAHKRMKKEEDNHRPKDSVTINFNEW